MALRRRGAGMTLTPDEIEFFRALREKWPNGMPADEWARVFMPRGTGMSDQRPKVVYDHDCRAEMDTERCLSCWILARP
jgi:hypothetical protein